MGFRVDTRSHPGPAASWLVATGSDSSACASLAPSARRGNVAQTCKFIMEFKTVTAMYPASRGHFSYSVRCRPQGAGDLPDCQGPWNQTHWLWNGVIPEFTSHLYSERAVTSGRLRDTPEPQFTHSCKAHKGIRGLHESNKARLYVRHLIQCLNYMQFILSVWEPLLLLFLSSSSFLSVL